MYSETERSDRLQRTAIEALRSSRRRKETPPSWVPIHPIWLLLSAFSNIRKSGERANRGERGEGRRETRAQAHKHTQRLW